MRKIKNLQKPLLIQYFISYVIILAIPMIFFSAFIHYRFRSALISEIQESRRYSLSNYIIREEKNIEKVQNIATSLNYSQELFLFTSPADYTQAKELISRLSNYAIGSNFPLIGVYWAGSDYIYSNIGTSSIDLLSKDLVEIQGEGSGWLHVFLSSTAPLTNQKDTYILYTMPLASDAHGAKRYIFFGQSVSQFLDSISYPANASDKLYIYNDKGDIIYGDAQELLSFLPPQESNEASESPSSFLSLDGQYLLHQLASSSTGLTFLSAAPLSFAMATANRLQTETLLCITAILMLSSLLIVLMIYYNYSPIQRLLQSVAHLFAHQQHKGNEIQVIQQAFYHLETQKNQIVHGAREASQDYYIRCLLKGQPLSAGDPSTAMFQPVFTHSRFSVCSLLIEQDNISTEKIRKEIQAFGLPHCLCFPVSENRQHSFAAILNFDGNDEEFHGMLDAIRNLMEDRLQCPVTLACGGVCQDEAEIPQIYMESIYALDYSYIKGRNCVILSEEVCLQDELDTSYPYVELQNLKKQLKQRNIEAINLQLDSILVFINTCDVPLFVARRISYDIVNMVLASLKDDELKHNQSYINSLTRFQTVKELAEAVYNIYRNLIEIPEDSAPSSQTVLSEMRAYVQDNFADPDFSLQIMADHFGMSLTGLSQYFKSKSGQTLIDYYSELRIALAKKLLAERKYKIDEIAAMTGYNNTSSFIRRFKQLTGVSPGHYSSRNS